MGHVLNKHKQSGVGANIQLLTQTCSSLPYFSVLTKRRQRVKLAGWPRGSGVEYLQSTQQLLQQTLGPSWPRPRKILIISPFILMLNKLLVTITSHSGSPHMPTMQNIFNQTHISEHFLRKKGHPCVKRTNVERLPPFFWKHFKSAYVRLEKPSNSARCPEALIYLDFPLALQSLSEQVQDRTEELQISSQGWTTWTGHFYPFTHHHKKTNLLTQQDCG